MEKIVIFDVDPEALLRILVVGTLTYFSIIMLLRVSGKRTLASMNAFDFIITVAMGAAFGRILTAKSVSFFEAFTTFALLVTLQFIISYISVRSEKFRKFTTSQPTLLYYKGEFLRKNMKKERLNEEDVLGAVRAKRISSIAQVEAIVFESNGNVTVIKKAEPDVNLSYESVLSKEK